MNVALHGLEDDRLAGPVRGDGRVQKYEHRTQEVFNFTRGEVAVMCVLLLRGPQTPGELRGRTERMHDFNDLDEVERPGIEAAELAGLALDDLLRPLEHLLLDVRLARQADGVRPLECLHVLLPPSRGHPCFVHRSSLLPSLKGNLCPWLNVRVQRNGSGALA